MSTLEAPETLEGWSVLHQMFRVRWERSALNELADLWTHADSANRQAITEATNTIDRLLQADPSDVGESRGPGERIVFVEPLGVTFDVVDTPATARVLHVWRIRRRSTP